MHQGIGVAKRRSLLGHVLRGWLAGCLAALGTVALAAPGAAGAASCPNESLRANSPQLADCRAYELVSPVDMNGNGLEQAFAVSPDGNAVGYGTINVFGDEAPSSVTGKWAARRGSEDWSSATLNVPTLGRVPSAYDEPVALAYSADLSTELLGTRYPVDPLDQAPYKNFSESGDADIYQVWPGGRSEWLSHGPQLPDTEYIDSGLAGASADLSRVFFQSREPLTPETEGSSEPNLYERHGTELSAVNVDEDGVLLPGGAAAGRGWSSAAAFYSGGDYSQGRGAQGHPFDPSAVSRDGSRVFFTAPLESPTASRQLYVRIDGATTEQISRCEFGACAGEGALDGAIFLFASPEGSTVTFYSSDRLIEAAPEGGGVYRYAVDSKTLNFLTPVDTSENVTEGLRSGGVLAESEDGSYLYLCQGGDELAVYHDGQVRPIAPIFCDAAASQETATEPTAARSGTEEQGVKGITQGEPGVTANTGYVFATTAGPTEIGDGYANEGHSEVYYYDAATAALSCLSCRPDGAPAQADSFLNHSSPRADQPFVAILSPVGVGAAVRNLSATGGRAFFVSTEALVPGDVNDSQDVYEWEMPGTGSCTTASAGYAAASGGCLSLVSSGESPEGAVFQGASEDGEDAFFATYAGLVPADTGTELQLYDARVDGGLAAQHATPPSPCPDASGCRGGSSTTPSATPTMTARFSGPGNSPVTAACVSLPPREKALRTKAKAARQQSSRAGHNHQKGRAKRMRSKSWRLEARAGRLARQAKQCAKANGGAAK
jgi:hypothetical protein